MLVEFLLSANPFSYSLPNTFTSTLLPLAVQFPVFLVPCPHGWGAAASFCLPQEWHRWGLLSSQVLSSCAFNTNLRSTGFSASCTCWGEHLSHPKEALGCRKLLDKVHTLHSLPGCRGGCDPQPSGEFVFPASL